MSRVLAWLKAQFVAVLPASIFFFVLFNVRNITDTLILGNSFTNPSRQLAIAALAFVTARVILLTDRLPFMMAFAGRPLIYTTLWKALIYSLTALIYRLVRAVVPLVIHERAFGPAWRRLLVETNWTRFWGIQVWLFMLLLLFVASRELIRVVGGGRFVGRLFFRQRTV